MIKYWIILLWIPVGRLYIVGWQLYKAGVTWKEIFTKQIYRIMIVESGIFGFLTPVFNWLVRYKQPKHLTELAPPEGKVEEKKFNLTFS